MQNSNAVVKKIYCIVINGKIQEKLDFDSMEIAKDYIKLFSLKYRQENTIAKGRPKTLNLLCDRKNKSAGNVSNCETRSGREQRRTLSKKRVVKEYSRRFNVWEVARGLNKTKHPAVFPERLANDHILSWSNKGDVVLDPFCGSGTTAKMAMLTGRKFIGFEISAEYCDIAEKRIASVGKDIPLFEAD